MNRTILCIVATFLAVATSADMQLQRGTVNVENLCHHQRVIKPLQHHQKVIKPLQKKEKPQKSVELDKTDTEVS